MSKSIAYYLNNGGTGPAVGKMFNLYGMDIGVFSGSGVGSLDLVFIHPTNGKMSVPIQTEMPIPIIIRGSEVKGPIINPVLEHIIQVS